ncbi:polymer-forming cytoskeletal protein [Sporolactobacillus kofuensis]|uniref:Polymer-forming cytoskeletal protein n=1 Tax=Sporolactobacillus kofuensis TaxID=269672 RepID=A0ABW1WFJ1_9BACL|nr:polymer-forming cytoskeletal protein [Sporolactobacillus kofuensis]MCO7175171.1 polymer-forming cytoskeletal protein [Sporolactobacillus kofuensis]
MEQKKNLTISGSGSAPGGSYEDVKINGSGKIHGDIICHSIAINGSGRLSGDAKATNIMISGSAVLEKNLISEAFTVNGACKVEGNVTGERIHISGRARILGAVHGEQIRISGILTVEGDLEGEDLIAEGPLTVGGLCSADRIEITLAGMISRIKEIGCGTLTVHRRFAPNFFGQLLPSFARKKLVVDSIEGDEIFLEDTEAKVVRGNRVTIGAGCTIGQVTYKTDYQKDDKAVVQSVIKG